MTAALAHLPLTAGGAVLSVTGQAIHWSIARYLRAPLAHTSVLVMVTFSALAGSNALYRQHEHPAPLFSEGHQRVAAIEPRVMPVVPKSRPVQVLKPLPGEVTTGSVKPAAAVPAADPIGNAEVSELQRKLTSMQLYDGAIDGLYGPQTARAIRRFEERLGVKPRGELTRELLESVRAAPVILPEARIEPLPTPDPLPQVIKPLAPPETAAVTATADVTHQAAADAPTRKTELPPLPTPAPLQLASGERPRLQRQLPDTPEAALDLAVQTAGEAIDTIIDGVQSMAMTTPSSRTPDARDVAASATAAVEALETASIAPKVGVPLAAPVEEIAKNSDDVAVLDTEKKPEELMPPFSVTDPQIVARVQRGLASLGFLYGPADGVAGEATAKAIRNFEVYYNYKVTGRISPELLDLLVQNGAAI